MINLSPIPKAIQERLYQKMKALGKTVAYPDTPIVDPENNPLTPEKMNTRTTFIRMVSDQKYPLCEIFPKLKTSS